MRLFWFSLLVLAGLWHGSQAHAAKLPDFKKIGANTNGNSVTLGPTGQSSAWSTAIPIPRAPSTFQPAGTAISIIGAAIAIRLVLQLIPFTRLGS